MRRKVVVSAIVAALLMTPMATSASAAPSVQSATVSASAVVPAAALPQVFPSISWHWWGVRLQYTKVQTRMIASGAAGAAGLWIGGTYVAVFAIAAVHEYALAAVDEGNCLQIELPWAALLNIAKARPGIYQC